MLPLVGLRELLGLQHAAVTATSKAIVLDAGTPVALGGGSPSKPLQQFQQTVSKCARPSSAHRMEEKLSGTFQSDANAEVAKVLDIEALLATAFAQRERPQRQLHAGAATRTAQGPTANAAPVAMLVTFDVAGQEFALDLNSVQEILPAPASVVSVPRAEALVIGVTSLRDRVLPLLSLRGLLGFPPKAESDGREKVVVMRVGSAQVGLVADRARSIVAHRRRQSIRFLPFSRRARAAKRASKLSIVVTRDGGSFQS